MKYSVCLPAVLRNMEVKKALEAVKAAGFNHFEFWGWWDLDLNSYLEAKEKEGLHIAALCTRFISLTDPACRQAYVKGLSETVEVCQKLGCKTIITQLGNELPGVSREAQHQSIVDGLRACIPLLKQSGLTLVIEPLNTRIDHPGYYLWSAKEAFEIIDEVNDPHVKVLYDLYHQYVMDDLNLDLLLRNIHKVGHFHMAGYPGRHEPFRDCEVDYPKILSAIRESGYEHCVGLEYFPVQDAVKGLIEFGHGFMGSVL